MATPITAFYTCTACKERFPTRDLMKVHCTSDFHAYNIARKVEGLTPVDRRTYEQLAPEARGQEEQVKYRCKICKKTYLTVQTLSAHLRSRAHQEAKMLVQYEPENHTANRCKNCGDTAHTLAACPLRECSRCHKQGHSAKNCPDHKKADTPSGAPKVTPSHGAADGAAASSTDQPRKKRVRKMKKTRPASSSYDPEGTNVSPRHHTPNDSTAQPTTTSASSTSSSSSSSSLSPSSVLHPTQLEDIDVVDNGPSPAPAATSTAQPPLEHSATTTPIPPSDLGTKKREDKAQTRTLPDGVEILAEPDPAKGEEEEKEADEPVVDLDNLEKRCLFCNRTANSVETNLRHMFEVHSFRLPYWEDCTDEVGLLSYLQLKIRGGICLFCNDRSRFFSSVAAVRRHMFATGHNMIDWDKDADEFAEFYNMPESNAWRPRRDYLGEALLPDGRKIVSRVAETSHTRRSNAAGALIDPTRPPNKLEGKAKGMARATKMQLSLTEIRRLNLKPAEIRQIVLERRDALRKLIRSRIKMQTDHNRPMFHGYWI